MGWERKRETCLRTAKEQHYQTVRLSVMCDAYLTGVSCGIEGKVFGCWNEIAVATPHWEHISAQTLSAHA